MLNIRERAKDLLASVIISGHGSQVSATCAVPFSAVVTVGFDNLNERSEILGFNDSRGFANHRVFRRYGAAMLAMQASSVVD